MNALLRRGFFLSFLFLSIAAIYIYFLLDLPLQESWFAFYEMEFVQFPDVPLIWWVLNSILALAWGIAIWTSVIGRTREKSIEHKITALINSDEEVFKHKKFSPRIDRALDSAANVLITQRKSLQRITEERAETQDELINERIIQERQRLARELHDSVSQQLFAASMLLSALTENNEDKETYKPLQQVERVVQQAQLEMRALLLHLRPAALNNKSLKECLEELLLNYKKKYCSIFATVWKTSPFLKVRKIIYSESHKKRCRIHSVMHKRQKLIYYLLNAMDCCHLPRAG